MATEAEFRAAAAKSDLVANLYSLKQHLFESGIDDKVFYLGREEGSFTRPSFFLRINSMPVDPYNGYMSWQVLQVQVQYFSEDMLDAHAVGDQVQRILAPRPDLILPRYDFTQDPPRKIPVSEQMGCRVDPTTVSSDPFQEPEGGWNVPITFTMRAPILSPTINNPLTHVYEQIVGPGWQPTIVTDINVTPNVEIQVISN